MNQLQLHHEYAVAPDQITVRLNNQVIYSGPGDVGSINFEPVTGTNYLTVSLDTKTPGNFVYNANTGQVETDSSVKINELIVQSRYFRSLLTKCGLVEIDLRKHPTFTSKYIDHENVITMEGSVYLIKFDYPVKNWMQIHLHGRDLDSLPVTNPKVKERLKL